MSAAIAVPISLPARPYPTFDDALPGRPVEGGPYRVGFAQEAAGPRISLPPLFEIYLRYGGRVVSPPALDRQFKTIDFLVLLDSLALDPRSRRLFFG